MNSTRFAKMNRRHFLIGGVSLAGAGLGLVSFLGTFLFGHPAKEDFEITKFGALFSGKEAAASQLGKTCLRSMGQESKREMVLKALLSSLSPPERISLEKGSVEEVRTLFRGRIHRDFEEGRTVSVEGWVLSQTELRLFKLAYLEEPLLPRLLKN